MRQSLAEASSLQHGGFRAVRPLRVGHPLPPDPCARVHDVRLPFPLFPLFRWQRTTRMVPPPNPRARLHVRTMLGYPFRSFRCSAGNGGRGSWPPSLPTRVHECTITSCHLELPALGLTLPHAMPSAGLTPALLDRIVTICTRYFDKSVAYYDTGWGNAAQLPRGQMALPGLRALRSPRQTIGRRDAHPALGKTGPAPLARPWCGVSRTST